MPGVCSRWDDDRARWLIVAGGDGYETRIVEGWRCLEQAFLETHLGPRESTSARAREQPEEEQALLLHLRDQRNWVMHHDLGRVSYSLALEDGAVEIIRLTEPREPSPPAPTAAQGVLTSQERHAVWNAVNAACLRQPWVDSTGYRLLAALYERTEPGLSDRFAYDNAAEGMGYMAREALKTLSSNPWRDDTHLGRSWIHGWFEADANINQPPLQIQSSTPPSTASA